MALVDVLNPVLIVVDHFPGAGEVDTYTVHTGTTAYILPWVHHLANFIPVRNSYLLSSPCGLVDLGKARCWYAFHDPRIWVRTPAMHLPEPCTPVDFLRI